MGREPTVLTEDVQLILQTVIKPDSPDAGEAVSLIAEKAETSNRTVYRVLGGESDTLSLDLADRLCLAADSHLTECRLVTPAGETVSYWDAI